MFCYTCSIRTKPLPIRHPWLSGSLPEHRVQVFLILFRTLSISKFQTYLYAANLYLNICVKHIGLYLFQF